MAAKDQKQQFDDIVARLTAEDPAFGDVMRGRRRMSNAARATLAAVGALVWGLLSVLMVVWGLPGVILTVAVLVVTVIVGVARSRAKPF